jgi:hypothetical protein
MAILDKVKQFKDIITALITAVSIGTAGWTYITTKFALKENVDYVQCLNDRSIKQIDIKYELYSLKEGLHQLYQQEAIITGKYKNNIPAQAYVELKKLTDVITQHQTQIQILTDKKSKQDERDCLKEIKNVK